MTRWPILACAALTPGPIAATMPQGSCPPMVGSLGAARPPGPCGGDVPAGLVPADGRLARRREPACGAPASWPAILVQVAAAHPGGFHLDDDLALARGRVGELHQLELAFAGKDNPAHSVLR